MLWCGCGLNYALCFVGIVGLICFELGVVLWVAFVVCGVIGLGVYCCDMVASCVCGVECVLTILLDCCCIRALVRGFVWMYVFLLGVLVSCYLVLEWFSYVLLFGLGEYWGAVMGACGWLCIIWIFIFRVLGVLA